MNNSLSVIWDEIKKKKNEYPICTLLGMHDKYISSFWLRQGNELRLEAHIFIRWMDPDKTYWG